MGATRTVGLLATVALLAACSGDDATEGPGKASNSHVVEWLEVQSEGSDWGQFEPVAVGDVMLAMKYGDDWPIRFRLMRSADLGGTWEAVELPGRPEVLSVTNWKSFQVQGGVAILTGTDGASDGAPYVWATTDGVDWRGGKLRSQSTSPTEIDVFSIDDVLYVALNPISITLDEVTPFELWRSDDAGVTWSPTQLDLGLEAGEGISTDDLLEQDALWKHSDARLVLPVASDALDSGDPGPTGPSQRHASALLSEDSGLSWHLGECPIPDLTEYEACVPPEQVGALAFDYEQVSVDGGRTWHSLHLDRSDVAAETAAPQIENAVEIPGGGWLAQGGNYIPSGDPFDFLIRSNDGLSWEMLLPPEGRPSATVSAPVRVGDRWLVAFSVTGRDESLHPSQLYLVDLDGTDLQPIPETESNGRFGTPVVIADTLLVPEVHDSKNWLVRVKL